MSCQQVSRYITNNNNNSNINNSVQTNSNCKNLNNIQNHISIKGNRTTRGVIQQDDPYVFTESAPTTPPILFTTQKTRARLNDLTSATNIGKLQQQKLPLAETNGKIASISNHIKTQASFLSSSLIATTNTCTAAPISKNNISQSLIGSATIANNNCNSKKLTNVCVVRPQLQTQQSTYNHHQGYGNALNEFDGDLKSISPPPLYSPPTPSLWQTPLLLESTTSTGGNTFAKVSNVALQKTTSQTLPSLNCVTTTVQTVGSTTTTTNPPLTTTAMAKVAPIIVHAPLAPPPPPSYSHSPSRCLPPSKFHNHTLAQHLKKVECLKKSKNVIESDTILSKGNASSITSPLKSYSPTLTPSPENPLTDNVASPAKHSENEDLNEIPVNVIFRMAVVSQANEKSSNNIQLVKPQTENDTQVQPSTSTTLLPPPPPPLPQPTQTPTASPSSSLNIQFKSIVNNKMSTPASKTSSTQQFLQLQQINTSSIQQQQLKATKTTANSQQYQMPKNDDDNDSEKPIKPENLTNISTDDSKQSETNIKKKNPTHILSKNRKSNSFFQANICFDTPHNWQLGCNATKGAVAVVKMSQHNIDLDTTHLATAIGLPYCLQQYWLNSYSSCKYSSELSMKSKSIINRSLAREEHIAMYKQQLRRKAMQLLSTRSLQALPFQLARRRLVCVDRLLRKYQQNEENKKEQLPANLKRCCVNGCDAYTLQMASHCQQHIISNAAQHVFLPCTAKFADNTQCRIPVFDIIHDLPLCMEHTRKRDAYNRHLYEQRPRKISANPMLLNESIVLTTKLSPANANVAGGIIMKTQKYQLKQQQQQHQHNILQQLPVVNNSSGNKLQPLINQQARKRKMATGLATNPVGRPQKRAKKSVENSVNALTATTMAKQQIPRLTTTNLKRKSSTTSLESIASNSQHSTTSSTSQQPQQYQRPQSQQHLYSVTPTIGNVAMPSLAPPALAPLSSGLVGHGLPQHLFSFGHDASYQVPQNHSQHKHQQHQHQQQQQQQQQQKKLRPINVNEKHSFSASTNSIETASTPTELKDIISQFSFISQKHAQSETITAADVNLLNTNSNSNFNSSGMGSTTSLPTGDDFLTQDMLSICENSSASSADTGLGGLSDPELMLGGPEDDIPLGDTHLLEEHDLENVLNSLPEDAFKELFTTVHQDESDEIERAIELADKHLQTLQQTIGSELGDFLDFSDDMLMDNADLCDGSTANTILDSTALFIGGGGAISTGTSSVSIPATATHGGGTVIGTDIRGLVQT